MNNSPVPYLSFCCSIEEAAANNNATDEASANFGNLDDESELLKLVDSILDLDDLNRDGYVSFYEFMTMQDKRDNTTPDPAPAN